MNTLAIVLIAAVCLAAAYLLYGRWLANKWGIDPAAKTPAQAHEDGQDYVPTKGFTVFCHQFSSIAGAGPVTGAIQAAAFGWLPVLLWVLLGGIFFGAVTDFGALYASVGKSIGLLIEKYIGKLGRKLFLLFCWLFTLLVIAAFADMVAGTFNAFTTVDGQVQLSEAARPNGAAGTISLLFILFAMVFGVLQKKFNLSGWKATVVGLVCTIAALAIGMALPITAGKDTWTYITFVYIFFAAVLPIWLLKQPRDMMTTYMFIGMIVGAVLGLLVAHPTMNLPGYTGFTNEKLGNMFPILFVTVACGAISGFHSLVSSDTSSKTIANEKDMLKVGYGAMVLESLLAVVALCVAGAAASAPQRRQIHALRTYYPDLRLPARRTAAALLRDRYRAGHSRRPARRGLRAFRETRSHFAGDGTRTAYLPAYRRETGGGRLFVDPEYASGCRMIFEVPFDLPETSA